MLEEIKLKRRNEKSLWSWLVKKLLEVVKGTPKAKS